MRYSIRHITLLSLLAMVLAACSSESYPGVEFEEERASSLINTESGKGTTEVPIVVTLSETGFFNSVVTRGTGPIIVPSENKEDSLRDAERYESAVFYIYAFRDQSDAQGNWTYSPDLTKRSGDESDNNTNCLVDSNDPLLGIPAFLDSDHSGVLRMKRDNLLKDTTLYYPNSREEFGYNFFCYHIDDFRPDASNAIRDHDGIYYKIDIDGTRDIMLGHAPRLTRQVLEERYSDITLTEEDRHHVLNVGNYSTFAAYQGINPIVDVHRTMTRLRFRGIPADESACDVSFNKIVVKARHHGTLCVANADQDQIGFAFDDELGDIELMERNPDGHGNSPYVPLVATDSLVTWKEGMNRENWQDEKNLEGSVVIGGDMLLPPATEFRMEITYTQLLKSIDEATGERKKQTLTAVFTMPAPKIKAQTYDEVTDSYWFGAGQTFNINIGVYGLRPIDCTATLNGWDDGGEIIIDDEY